MGTKTFFGIGFLILAFAFVFLLPSSGLTDVGSFPNSQMAVVDGTLLHYRLWQPAGEPVGHVLLVHGLGGSTFSWRFTAPALVEAGYLVTAVDLPGFGYSDRSRGLDHSQQNRAQLLWKLVESQLPFPFADDQIAWHLVGHSMGGGTITAMVEQHPLRTASLTYAAGAVYNQPPRLAGLLLQIPVLDRILAAAFRLIFLRTGRIEGVLESAYGRAPTSDELAGYADPLLLSGTELSLIDITSSQGEPVSSYLERIQVSALLLWGAEDSWVPVEQGERMAAELAVSHMFIHPNAAHCTMETEPTWFNTHLLDFLRALESPEPLAPQLP